MSKTSSSETDKPAENETAPEKSGSEQSVSIQEETTAVKEPVTSETTNSGREDAKPSTDGNDGQEESTTAKSDNTLRNDTTERAEQNGAAKPLEESTAENRAAAINEILNYGAERQELDNMASEFDELEPGSDTDPISMDDGSAIYIWKDGDGNVCCKRVNPDIEKFEMTKPSVKGTSRDVLGEVCRMMIHCGVKADGDAETQDEDLPLSVFTSRYNGERCVCLSDI